MKLLLGTNLFGNNNRQHIARESWMHIQKAQPDKLDLIAIQFKSEFQNVKEKMLNDELVEYQDYKIPALHILENSSKNIVEGSNRTLPLFYDILEKIFIQAEFHKDHENITHFGYINSDCIITDTLIEYLEDKNPHALAISRLEIENTTDILRLKKEGAKVLRNEIAGYDCFIFSKEWFTDNRHLFNAPYLIGVPTFDVVTAGIIKLNGGELYNDSSKPLVCHMMHENVSHDSTVEKDYNENLMKSNKFHHLVMNVMFYHLQYNLCRRTPWGVFLTPKEGENDFTDRFFNIMRLDTDNHINYIA